MPLPARELHLNQVAIQDSYWSPRLAVNSQRAIFHQWQQLEASGCIDNFRILADEKEGLRTGWFFADSDAYKWLEAAARIQASSPSSELAGLMQAFVDLLSRAQSPDGYLFTYNQLHFPGQRWLNLQVEHELYCHGHLIEAGIAHFEATATTRALDLAVRAADLIGQDFLDRAPDYTCGHEEIELALLRLYRAVGNEKYLELARQFLERRGRIRFFSLKLARQFWDHNRRASLVRQQRQAYLRTHPDYQEPLLPPGNYAKKPRAITQRWYLNALSGHYAQQHAPVRAQRVPSGHAVRFAYLETALTMLHRLQPDESLLASLEQAWERMVLRRMYLTGGIGSLPGLEGFGGDYELDPDYAYAETCAALASLFWNWEMSLATGQARYSDLFEWQLYNAATVGMGRDGASYLYNNPLACQGGIERRPWFSVPCCPSNLSRTFASLGRYIFSFSASQVWVQ